MERKILVDILASPAREYPRNATSDFKASADINNKKKYVDLQQFCFHCLPVLSTRLALFQGNTLENSGKGNPQTGLKSPPSSDTHL
jgi:hypothetical protein